jgi:hypothetical protein
MNPFVRCALSIVCAPVYVLFQFVIGSFVFVFDRLTANDYKALFTGTLFGVLFVRALVPVSINDTSGTISGALCNITLAAIAAFFVYSFVLVLVVHFSLPLFSIHLSCLPLPPTTLKLSLGHSLGVVIGLTLAAAPLLIPSRSSAIEQPFTTWCSVPSIGGFEPLPILLGVVGFISAACTCEDADLTNAQRIVAQYEELHATDLSLSDLVTPEPSVTNTDRPRDTDSKHPQEHMYSTGDITSTMRRRATLPTSPAPSPRSVAESLSHTGLP